MSVGFGTGNVYRCGHRMLPSSVDSGDVLNGGCRPPELSCGQHTILNTTTGSTDGAPVWVH